MPPERQLQGKRLSLVVPCYNEEEVILAAHKRLVEVLSQCEFKLEIIYINDGSTDQTENILNRLCDESSFTKVIHFSRNFGHQTAVTAGLQHTQGDIAVVLDADLQDPPEVIHEMIIMWKRGYDVVYGQRTDRVGETRFKLLTAKYFYVVLSKLSNTNIPRNTGDFRLMDRKVVDAVNSMPESDRFLRGIVSWVGFKQTPVFYQRRERAAGVTKYPFLKMIRFAADGIFSFSNKPLRLATWSGLAISFASLLAILYAVGMRVFSSHWVSGWTFLAVAILFMGGIQLLFLGLIGEYIGRIYQAAKNRPLYLIKDARGFESDQ